MWKALITILRTFLIGGGRYDRTAQRRFFPSGTSPVAIEPRLPQAAFPEHHHDFHEIVIVEHGTGIHVFNGQPYTISGGMVCFVRDHDRHLYEHTDNLCLTNVLYRSPDAFQFLSGLNKLLPQEQDGHYPSHWRVNQSTLQQVRQLVNQLEQSEDGQETHAIATRELLFMQLLVLLRRSSLVEGLANNDARLNQLMAGWRTISPRMCAGKRWRMSFRCRYARFIVSSSNTPG